MIHVVYMNNTYQLEKNITTSVFIANLMLLTSSYAMECEEIEPTSYKTAPIKFVVSDAKVIIEEAD